MNHDTPTGRGAGSVPGPSARLDVLDDVAEELRQQLLQGSVIESRESAELKVDVLAALHGIAVKARQLVAEVDRLQHREVTAITTDLTTAVTRLHELNARRRAALAEDEPYPMKEESMAPRTAVPFTGFPLEGLDLLRDLAANNHRRWYEAHRPLVEELLIEPGRQFVTALGPLLTRRVSPGLRAEPRVGGSLLPMQRPGRFLPGGPYRTDLMLAFWEGPLASPEAHPALYVRLGLDELRIGAGFPLLIPPALLPNYRLLVDQDETGAALIHVLNRLVQRDLRVGGPQLRRVPRPYPPDHPRTSLMTRLGLVVEYVEPLPAGTAETILGPGLPERVVKQFMLLVPLHRWLLRLQEEDGDG